MILSVWSVLIRFISCSARSRSQCTARLRIGMEQVSPPSPLTEVIALAKDKGDGFKKRLAAKEMARSQLKLHVVDAGKGQAGVRDSKLIQ